MKISDVEATGSGWGRAEVSEAKAQVAGYGARPGGRPRRPGRARPERHLLLKRVRTREMCFGADGQSLTVSSCLPLQHT